VVSPREVAAASVPIDPPPPPPPRRPEEHTAPMVPLSAVVEGVGARAAAVAEVTHARAAEAAPGPPPLPPEAPMRLTSPQT
jgi:hypothetical protein